MFSHSLTAAGDNPVHIHSTNGRDWEHGDAGRHLGPEAIAGSFPT
jgi:hypothetical protein